ncbi:MAG: hypothetical protein LBO00_06565 [Zoogloeaceae bacterium]|jgi:tRNA A-37 threonylcarbamoyl transferase component Bud32|nr:hypothetical protein [Zoogloeaceae bacterium]
MMPEAPLPLAALARAGRDPETPCVFTLPTGGLLRILRFVRVLPGRRYVGIGEWEGRRVFAKLFTGPRAGRDFGRETTGIRLLTEHGIETPRLLAAHHAGQEGGWLLLELLEDAVNLDERWRALEEKRDATARATQRKILADALRLIGRLHAQGLAQDDLHPGNLLYRQDTLYLVDGGGILSCALRGRQCFLENLALFFAQFPPHWDHAGMDLLTAYEVEFPHSVDRARLNAAIARQRTRRIAHFLRKTTRDCSQFQVGRQGFLGASGFCALRRDAAGILMPLLANPDAWIARGKPCKLGASASVLRLTIDGQALILKRYNLKNAGHRLRRALRESRAAHAWREGNRLMALGIPTARPLAFLERRKLGLRGTSFLVTEFVRGDSLLTRLPADWPAHAPLPQAELTALVELFTDLTRLSIRHGDLKGSNLIWQEEEESGQDEGDKKGGRWVLIDLDATRQYQSRSRFCRAHVRDRQRLLANWPPQNPLRHWLETHLPRLVSGQEMED